MVKPRTPLKVRRALADLGEHIRDWRRLGRITQELTAERAGVSVSTVRAIEAGRSVSTDSLLRVLNVLGTLNTVVQAADPLSSDVGKMRAGESLPQRVRTPRSGGPS